MVNNPKTKEERKDNELVVFIKAKSILSYILLVSSKSPVKYRYSLLNTLINESLDMIHLLYEANELDPKDKIRAEKIRSAMARLKTIDFVSSVARDAGCFTQKQYDILLGKIGDCSKFLLGYYNHAKKASAI